MLWQMRLAFQNAIIYGNPLVNKRNFEREVRQSGRNRKKGGRRKEEGKWRMVERRRGSRPLLSSHLSHSWRSARHLSTENHTGAAFILGLSV